MYTWTVASAVWQVQHGGPTQRTLSAIDWLNDMMLESKFDTVHEIAAHLLDSLVEERGLQHLGDALQPLPDETETTQS
jgi:hypothetical protein